jgi:hypothetical protein
VAAAKQTRLGEIEAAPTKREAVEKGAEAGYDGLF